MSEYHAQPKNLMDCIVLSHNDTCLLQITDQDDKEYLFAATLEQLLTVSKRLATYVAKQNKNK